MTEKVARQWLADVAATANEKNHPAHMDLISRRVSLQGVPGFENIGHEEWAAQCKHEFENNVLKSVRYDGLKLITSTDSHIMFKTFETIEGSDGTVNAQGVEILLEKEDDEKWRLVQERVLPADEAAHDNLATR